MKDLEKIIEGLIEKAKEDGKKSDNIHIKDYNYGKVMAYHDILIIMSDLEA